MARNGDETTIAVWVRLLRTGETILEEVERALKAEGLPPLAWYDVLWELEKAGPGGLRPMDLQDRLLLPQYGTSRLVARLVAADLVEAGPVEGDGRGQLLRLTQAGAGMRARMWPVYSSALRARIEGRLDEGERAALAALLTKLRGGPG